MIMSSRALAWFLGSLLVVSWAVQAVALHTVGDVNSDAMMPWLLGMMFAPTLWSVTYLAIFNRGAWKLIRFWPGNPIYLVLAALIPAALGLGALAIAEQQGWAVSSFFRFGTDGVNVSRGPWVMGDGAQRLGFLRRERGDDGGVVCLHQWRRCYRRGVRLARGVAAPHD